MEAAVGVLEALVNGKGSQKIWFMVSVEDEITKQMGMDRGEIADKESVMTHVLVGSVCDGEALDLLNERKFFLVGKEDIF